MSLVDMYIETGDPTEKCGELNFSLDYDFATQTLKLKMIQVRMKNQSCLMAISRILDFRHLALWA